MSRFFPPEGYLSIPAAAIRLCSGETTLYKWIEEGKLAAEEFQRYPSSPTVAKAIALGEIERYEATIRARFGTRTFPEHERRTNPTPVKARIPQRATDDFTHLR